MQMKKTRAEIRKLELESAALQGSQALEASPSSATQIRIADSPGTSVILATDPLMRGPLLILLEFIIAWIVLRIASYPLNFFLSYSLSSLCLLFLAIVLLFPIYKEAKRLRTLLQPEESEAER